MVTQSEKELENELINLLKEEEYEYIPIKDEDDLEKNFRVQLEKLNDTKLTDEEFKGILTYLKTGSLFDKAEKLRDYYPIEREDRSFHIRFLNQDDLEKNIFQVSHQISIKADLTDRYDVTILINGLPLVQIELKRRGVELKKAFDQVVRYKRESFTDLFDYIQIFVISNGIDTKYFANDGSKQLNYLYSFFWMKDDKDNTIINRLDEFTNTFLNRYNLAEMISKYMVLNKTTQSIIVLRAYQKYAVEKIIKQAMEVQQNGYIWHTTGSGKTLTSFKASQILAEQEDVYKVIFVVDRRDLDLQTTNEFNSFQEDSINSTDNTKILIKHLTTESTGKLVLTTIQKLSKATKDKKDQIESINDKKIILIYDECHRSQFGTMHNNITNFFTNCLSFGFTGTPIFDQNSKNSKTTKTLFGDRLHQYLIKDAIRDGNVLGFSIDYFGANEKNSKETLDSESIYESVDRLNGVVNNIIKSYDYKTKNRKFNAIFATPSVEILHKYYELFKKKDHDLKIATVFSYQDNEELPSNDKSSRQKLDSYIKDYNEMFNTNFSVENLQPYYSDVFKRMKNRDIDLLIVVRMFLTGFDSKILNTLYLDQTLEYHGLLQAMSRTNRIYDNTKTQGNIVSFRDIKKQVDESLTLFSDGNPTEDILLPSHDLLVKQFNNIYHEMMKEFDNINNIEQLGDEKKAKFVLLFKQLAQLKNKLDIYTSFPFDGLDMSEQQFDDFKSKYLDVSEYVKDDDNDASILYDIDFELELLRNDIINVDYILNLIEGLDTEEYSYESDKQRVLNIVNQNEQLRNKEELIGKFIDSIENQEDVSVSEEFDTYMQDEKNKQLDEIIETEDLDKDKIKKVYYKYEDQRKLYDDDIEDSFNQEVDFLEAYDKTERIKDAIKEIFKKFNY